MSPIEQFFKYFVRLSHFSPSRYTINSS